MGEGQADRPFRYRHDGVTPARQTLFLARLRETGCVADAARTAGISANSARRAKKRIPEFADKWDMALLEERPVLRQAAFERAVFGVDEPVVSGGKLLGTRRRYSDGLLRLLLEHDAGRRGGDGGGRGRPPPRPIEEVRASILDKLRAIRTHERAKEQVAALAFAERMRAEGWAP